VGIRRGGRRLGLRGFYRARAAWRYAGGEVVWQPTAGHCQKGKKRRRGCLGGDARSTDRRWLLWRWERRAVRPSWPIGPQLSDKKECWAKNGEKNRNLDYKF
jgi:hypothetical protein